MRPVDVHHIHFPFLDENVKEKPDTTYFFPFNTFPVLFVEGSEIDRIGLLETACNKVYPKDFLCPS